MLAKTGLANEPDFKAQLDKRQWPALSEKLTDIFKTKTRDQWCELMEGTDVCFAPVLSLSEAPHHPHNVDRKTFLKVDGQIQPAPAPRFSVTQAGAPRKAPQVGDDTVSVLKELGHDNTQIEHLKAQGVIQ